MRKYVFLAVALYAGAGGSTASAHHPGIGGVAGSGGITTIGAGTLDQGQGAVAFLLEYSRFRQLSDTTLITNGVHGIKSIEARTLSLAYGLTNDMMIMLRMPWIGRTGILEGDTGAGVVNDRGGSSGFGDMTLLGQYRFFNNQASGSQVAALFGVKAPTGAMGRIDALGEPFESEFQPGTGSWDILLGAAYSQRLSAKWGFHANVLGVITGTGTQDTNPGNRLLYNAALAYRVFGETALEPHRHANLGYDAYAHVLHGTSPRRARPPVKPDSHISLDAMLELNGEWHDRQRISGIADPNSGGNTIYVAPGLRLSVENVSSYVSVGLPVVTEVNGVQAKAAWRLMTGIAAVFGP